MPSMWLETKTPRFSVAWSSSTSLLVICSKPVKRSLGLFKNPLSSNDDTSRSVRNNHWWRTQEKKPCVRCCVLLLWPQQKGTVNCMTVWQHYSWCLCRCCVEIGCILLNSVGGATSEGSKFVQLLKRLARIKQHGSHLVSRQISFWVMCAVPDTIYIMSERSSEKIQLVSIGPIGSVKKL